MSLLVFASVPCATLSRTSSFSIPRNILKQHMPTDDKTRRGRATFDKLANACHSQLISRKLQRDKAERRSQAEKSIKITN